jgi:hypothetical protein
MKPKENPESTRGEEAMEMSDMSSPSTSGTDEWDTSGNQGIVSWFGAERAREERTVLARPLEGVAAASERYGIFVLNPT